MSRIHIFIYSRSSALDWYSQWQLRQLTQNSFSLTPDHQVILIVECPYVNKMHVVLSGFRDLDSQCWDVLGASSLSLVIYVEKLLIFSAWVEAVRFCLWTDEFCHYSSSPPEPAGGNWKWVLFSASLVSSFAAQSTNAHTHAHTHTLYWEPEVNAPLQSIRVLGFSKRALLWFYGATIWSSEGQGKKRKRIRK